MKDCKTLPTLKLFQCTFSKHFSKQFHGFLNNAILGKEVLHD